MNIDLKRIVPIAAVLALPACAQNMMYEAPGDAAFGEANRQTMMAQVVNPEPVYDEPMETSGERAVAAIERYLDDAVKEPEGISTTQSVGGSN